MRLIWSRAAERDLVRLYRFLAAKNPRAASAKARSIRVGALRLLELPRLGARLDKVDHREARRVFIDDYELQYELVEDVVFVLRVFHTREQR